MLKAIGADSVDDLFADLAPELRLQHPLPVPPGLSELELQQHLAALAARNTPARKNFLGAGAYDHFIPATVDAIISRSEFYTSYTPYQPEVAQGNLQVFYEYQSMICELTGMEVSNASLYDGASALAEAALMCVHQTGKKEILLSRAIHPEYRETIKTYCRATDVRVKELDIEPAVWPQDWPQERPRDRPQSTALTGQTPALTGRTSLASLRQHLSAETAGVLLQSPNFLGCIEDLAAAEQAVHAVGALLVVCVVEPTSLGVLKPPGVFGADIVVGEGQGLGLPLNFGGPYLGFMATKQVYMRKMPGRITGMTVDARGEEGFVLTLQAREQHIRREAANSNICSNQALCALAATVYLATLGKQGFRQVADICLHRAHYLYNTLLKVPGFKPVFQAPFYNEFVIRCTDAARVHKQLQDHGIAGGLLLSNFYPELKDCLLFCVTELNTKADLDQLVDLLA
jgi:glycine dehydrogenase subunit 1